MINSTCKYKFAILIPKKTELYKIRAAKFAKLHIISSLGENYIGIEQRWWWRVMEYNHELPSKEMDKLDQYLWTEHLT